MHNKAVLNYWQQAQQYLKIMDFKPAEHMSTAQIISRDECLSGRICNERIINYLLPQGARVLIAPIHWQKNTEHFIPFFLCVDLTADGIFKTVSALSLPIVPRNILEPELMSSISLGNPEEFDDYFVLQPPCWFEEPKDLTWDNQYQYANQMLSSITCGKWIEHLAQLGYQAQQGARVFPMSLLGTAPVMDLKLLQNKSKIELIAAERNSGKSTYAKHRISESWIEAAVKQAPAPRIVWLQAGQEARYTSIFACAQQSQMYTESSEYKSTQVNVHTALSQTFNTYIRGKQVLRNWQELEIKLKEKYLDKGGIAARIKQLQVQLKEAHARHRHMQVLQSIYLRQSELVSNWSKMFDIFTTMQKQRLQRLYQFFKQNFPQENTNELTQAELDNLMIEKLNRARNSERCIADALHQATSDQRQQELVAEKLMQWGLQVDPAITAVTEVEHLVQEVLWQQVLDLASKYWQLSFAISGRRNEFFTCEPDSIDLLIVEHGEYIDPMFGAELLARSQRAIIMGNYSEICNPRFAVTVDYEMCKQFKLVSCDADYEDMQFEGTVAALGNLWSLAANGKEADQTFTARYNPQLEYEFCNIVATNAAYLGSKINRAEADAVHSWLLRYNPDPQDVCIYTTHAAQVQLIMQRLQNSKYTATAVRLVYKPCITKTKFVLFSTVYAATETGPYCFDRGVEILDNLQANALQKLIVFGDRKLFKPELHSAAGKFAKMFAPVSEKNIQQIEAVHV